MPHAKTQIRNKFKSILAGLPTTGSRVYGSRVYPTADLPALAIYALGDDWPESAQRNPQRRRKLRGQVVIEGRVKAGPAFDAVCDQIQLEVEQAVDATTNLEGLVSTCEYLGADTEILDELEKEAGVVRIRYAVTWWVAAGAPDIILHAS